MKPTVPSQKTVNLKSNTRY
ncbi:Protein of unknown function [Pyronema omphalodes CBS 100304]|uniref:Uncharacterized protein n=1 Tax=Pyronema omphalodes (strain CBS 100304) TaxID=1076935 RepID=U4LV49_PYROM|nr:Protein of unknown function [Pyronema omphalodes CBS 100304]